MAWRQIRLVPDNDEFVGSLFPSTVGNSIKYNSTGSSGIASDYDMGTSGANLKALLGTTNIDNVVITGWAGNTSINTVSTSFVPTAWNASIIGRAYGGTGLSALTAYALVISSATASQMGLLANSANKVLTSNGTSLLYDNLALAGMSNSIPAIQGGGLAVSYAEGNSAVNCVSTSAYQARTKVNIASDMGVSRIGHNHSGAYVLLDDDSIGYDLALNGKKLDNVAMEVVNSGALATTTYPGHIQVQKQSSGVLSSVHYCY